MTDEEKTKAIAKEKRRLKRIYKNLPADKLSEVLGLIDRAAYLRAMCEFLEDDLLANGFTEWFVQGNTEPYQRLRPQAQQYNTMNAQYTRITKVLDSFIPKASATSAKEQSDGFDDFVEFRDDE